MRSLHHLVVRHRWLAVWLVTVALLARAAIPTGFMPVFSGGAVTIELCSGYGPMTMAVPMAAPMAMAMPGTADHHVGQREQGKAEMPCAFSSLASPSLGGADPILLAAAIFFAVKIALFAVTRWRASGIDRLRPPPRGPPYPA